MAESAELPIEEFISIAKILGGEEKKVTREKILRAILLLEQAGASRETKPRKKDDLVQALLDKVEEVQLVPAEEVRKSRDRVSAKSPGKSSAKSPTKSPAKSPTKSSAKSPTKSSAKSPGKSSAKSPTKSPGKSPAKSPATWASTLKKGAGVVAILGLMLGGYWGAKSYLTPEEYVQTILPEPAKKEKAKRDNERNLFLQSIASQSITAPPWESSLKIDGAELLPSEKMVYPPDKKEKENVRYKIVYPSFASTKDRYQPRTNLFLGTLGSKGQDLSQQRKSKMEYLANQRS